MAIPPPPLPQSFFERNGPYIVSKFEPVLFEHQKEALRSILEWFRNPDTAVQTAVVSMPTGSGKTGVMCCLPYFLGKHVVDGTLKGINLMKPILVLAPGKQILKQLTENLSGRDEKAFLLKQGILTEEEIDYHFNLFVIKEREDIAPNLLSRNHVCLVNAQKGHKEDPDRHDLHTWKSLREDLFSVVIVDEAHHLPAPLWKDIIDRFKAHAKVVFFTATPYRSDGRDITEDIRTTGLCYHMTRVAAVGRRIIRDITPIGFEQTQDEPVGDVMQRLLSKIYQLLRDKNERFPFPDRTKKHMAILCAPCKEDAEEIAEEWNDTFPGQLKAAFIHSRMIPPRQRERVMRNLKAGKLALIVIVQMLLEGFDHAPISVAAIGKRISSPVKFAQFIGRAQRIYRQDGETERHEIKADIISDPSFKQAENWTNFVNEALIPVHDVPNED